MRAMTKAQKAERDTAIAKLRRWIKPGDTVYTILDSVSRSGMSRQIRVVIPYVDTESCRVRTAEGYDTECELTYGRGSHGDIARHRIDFLHPNYSVAKALRLRQAKRGDGVILVGCGGVALVYDLGRVLYPEFCCIGQGCPSNDHGNGDRDYTPGKLHSDGGYSLRHRWL